MSYENFKYLPLTQWINNKTRLNQENMTELREVVRLSSDALLDERGSGLIPDVKALNITTYGDAATLVVGSEKKIETLNSYIFGNEFQAYTREGSIQALKVPESVTSLLTTTIKDATIEGSRTWNVKDVNLDPTQDEIDQGKIPLFEHSGALSYLCYTNSLSKINKEHLTKIEAVYRPNQVAFSNSGARITSDNSLLLVNAANGLSVVFGFTGPSIKITRDGLIHTATESLPSIGSKDYRFETVYSKNIDTDTAVIGNKLTVNGGASFTGALEVSGTLDVTNQGSTSTSVVIKDTLEESINTLKKTLYGNPTDTIIKADNSVDDSKTITLTSLRNAINTYAVRWQSM